MDLETRIIRTIWTLVEKSNPYSLLKLSDREISQKLIQEMQNMFALSLEDSKSMSKYIGSRTVLIRDLADSKVH